MLREKQIEELGKIICGMENGCDGCVWNKARCNERNYAEEICKAGYRKQSEVTKEIFEEIERTLDNYHSACCPIGEIETYSYYEGDLGEAIAELKKNTRIADDTASIKTKSKK